MLGAVEQKEYRDYMQTYYLSKSSANLYIRINRRASYEQIFKAEGRLSVLAESGNKMSAAKNVPCTCALHYKLFRLFYLKRRAIYDILII